jgi:hypothetical protein
VEYWRFYQSAQFVHLMGIRSDWIKQSHFDPARYNWEPGAVLLVMDTLYHFVEIFELAARFASATIANSSIVVRVTLNGLKGRELLLESPTRAGFSTPRKASLDAFPQEFQLSRDEALGNTRKNAYAACRELFSRFGWSPADSLLEGMVAELRRSGFQV